MNVTRNLLFILASALLVGCGPSSNPKPSGSASVLSVSNSWAFEGTYIDTNYHDYPTVTFKAGRYSGSWPSNPGGDMNGSGHYTVREVADGKWELDLKYDEGSLRTTVIVRKDGENIAIRDQSVGREITLLKK